MTMSQVAFSMPRIVVVRRQRVPVGNEEQARIVVLEPDPVLEDAVVVAEVQAARGAHAGEDAFLIHVRFCF